jgi:uncharacterized protein
MAFLPVALITGASSGIGEALAHVFAAHGHQLVLVARNETMLKRVADSIAAGGKSRPAVVSADLSRMDAGARLGHELATRGLEPAFVVNNAGFGLGGQAETLDRAEQLSMIDLNVRTLTDFSLRWIDSARRHGGGILNVASVAGFFPGPGMAVYYATKAYVVSFTQALHHELAGSGVRVTALCPPYVPTNFQARAGIDGSTAPKAFTEDAQTVAREGYEGLMAGKRLVMPGTPNKLAVWVSGMAPAALVLRAIGRHNMRRKPGANPSWPRPGKEK